MMCGGSDFASHTVPRVPFVPRVQLSRTSTRVPWDSRPTRDADGTVIHLRICESDQWLKTQSDVLVPLGQSLGASHGTAETRGLGKSSCAVDRKPAAKATFANRPQFSRLK
jgi:hypothetical protein